MGSLRFFKLGSLLHRNSYLCSEMKFLVLLLSFSLFVNARKFNNAVEVREHLESVKYEELSRAAEATAKDALHLAEELDRVLKAENRLPDITGCINCAVELVPNVMECIAGGLKGCLCGFLDLIPAYGLIIKQVLGILGICAR